MQNILEIIERNSTSEGFTEPLRGELKRYIVALTDNTNPTISQLKSQVEAFSQLENLNIGGWVDNKTNIKYIDVSTSFAGIDEAMAFGRAFNQKAIFDIEKFEEIRLD